MAAPVVAVEPTTDRLPLVLASGALGLGVVAVVIAALALAAARRRPGAS